MGLRAADDHVDILAEHAAEVGDALPGRRKAGVVAQKEARAAEVHHRRLEAHPRPQAGLLEHQRQNAARQERVAAALGGAKADAVLSDMSPNISGIASADQARAAEENARLTQEVAGLQAQLAEARQAGTEVSALREERDVIRGRVSDMLQQLEQIAL